jgi:hypothetical protein
MATGDRTKTPNQWQHEILEAAEERGWEVTRMDIRAGVTLEEPRAGGIVMNLLGKSLDSMFIRSLPEARLPDAHTFSGLDVARKPDQTVSYSRADPNR